MELLIPALILFMTLCLGPAIRMPCVGRLPDWEAIEEEGRRMRDNNKA